MRLVAHCAGALAIISLAACNVPGQEDSADAGGVDALLVDGIDVRQVEAIVEHEFKDSARHTLTMRFNNDTTEPHFVEWARQYDGIDMATQVMSVLQPTGWEVRWRRELAEPEPVRTNDLVSFAQAAENVGLGDAFARGEVKARLLYRPKWQLLPGANDGELVVESYQLVVALEELDYTSYVDAYSGRLVERVPQYTTVDEYDHAMAVQTVRLGQVTINATRHRGVRLVGGRPVLVWSAPYYKDLTRASLLDSYGRIVDGQGFSTNDEVPHVYANVNAAADYRNDIVFALQESWNFYSDRFGRRGLRDLQPSVTTVANDAIARIVENGCSGGENACMNAALGRLTITNPTPNAYEKWTVIDIMGHEWTHAVFAQRAEQDMDLYWGEEGGLDLPAFSGPPVPWNLPSRRLIVSNSVSA